MKQQINWSLLQNVADPIADLITSNKNETYRKKIFSGANGFDSDLARRVLMETGDIGAAGKIATISKILGENNKAPKTVASPQGPMQWNGTNWEPIAGAGPKKSSAEITIDNNKAIMDRGKKALTSTLGVLTDKVLTLDKSGGMVNPDRGMAENAIARAQSTGIGQLVGNLVGGQAGRNQSTRKAMLNIRPIISNQIRIATGMSARAMDSNYELQTYLDSLADPNADNYSNLVTIDVLDRTYGLGGLLDSKLPPDMLAKVRAGSDQAIATNPIPDSIEQDSGDTAPKAQPSPQQQQLYEQHKNDPGFLEEWNKRFGQ